MIKLTGKAVFGGVAIGKILILEKEDQSVKRVHVTDIEKELERVTYASEQSVLQLQELYDKAVVEIGESGAAVFEAHQMMIQDEDYQDSIKHMITTQSTNAEFAIAATADNFSNMFLESKNEYMQARAADVEDISARMIAILLGKKQRIIKSKEPVIIIADDLTPGETVQMDKRMVLAFVTRRGSANSHTAILARTMNIPAIVGLDYSEDSNGKTAIVDGTSGVLIVDPDPETEELFQEKIRSEIEQRQLLLELRGKESVTKSGKKIQLYANIGNSADVALVHQYDGEGIGLFRSEFLFLGRETYPTEEEQFQIYKVVAQNMAGKKVIIRTLDIGADKQVEYFHLDKEENPAMGYRAIRICLDRVDLFKTQLRALFRASAFGHIAIMYPMIISLGEVKRIKEIVAEVKQELENECYPFVTVEQGVMIETPAAVMISDLLADEVDFFSIGTNDLTQYTLAIDRQNVKLDSSYDSHHLAILRMIELVVKNAHQKGRWVGICGELAADLSLTKMFLDMDVDELSVAPSLLLGVRKMIREQE